LDLYEFQFNLLEKYVEQSSFVVYTNTQFVPHLAAKMAKLLGKMS